MQNLITSIIFGTEGVRECSHHKDISSHFYLFQNLTMLLHRSFLPMAVSPSGFKKTVGDDFHWQFTIRTVGDNHFHRRFVLRTLRENRNRFH